MSRRARVSAVLPVAALALALLAGCGQQHGPAAGSGASDGTSPGASPSTSTAPSAAQLARMQKLVDEADSAAAVEESDAAKDK